MFLIKPEHCSYLSFLWQQLLHQLTSSNRGMTPSLIHPRTHHPSTAIPSTYRQQPWHCSFPAPSTHSPSTALTIYSNSINLPPATAAWLLLFSIPALIINLPHSPSTATPSTYLQQPLHGSFPSPSPHSRRHFSVIGCCDRPWLDKWYSRRQDVRKAVEFTPCFFFPFKVSEYHLPWLHLSSQQSVPSSCSLLLAKSLFCRKAISLFNQFCQELRIPQPVTQSFGL